jgi:hypothetical protein
MRFYSVVGAIAICLVLGACDDSHNRYYLTDVTPVPISADTIDQYFENPLPLPVWLDIVERTAVQRHEKPTICAGINGGAIVQIGQQDLDNTLQQRTIFSVDWQIIKQVVFWHSLSAVIRNNTIYGNSTVCADVSGFASGRHLAHLEINLTHQVQYDHTWAFEIP